MYEILFSPAATRDYKKIPQKDIPRLNKAIDTLAQNPRPVGYKKLRGVPVYTEVSHHVLIRCTHILYEGEGLLIE
ncbi:MAG: hypothetical protein CVV44_09925 [Spirochaetae bacterium HGW-Spirochaetae-1]|jgi:hypothetical protein|nr:MAG: hypothetical protein CVV44_09925 [Spirochaetae bacterium HGW-Spirochaetae-1]